MSGKSTYIDHAQERGEDDVGKLRQRAEKAEAELADCGEELLQEQEANRNNCGNWNLQVDELKDELAECKKLLEFVDRIPCPNCKELEAERDRLKQDIKGIVNQNATLHIENQGLREALEGAVKILDGMIQGSAIEGARPSGLYGCQPYPSAGDVEEAIQNAREALEGE